MAVDSVEWDTDEANVRTPDSDEVIDLTTDQPQGHAADATTGVTGDNKKSCRASLVDLSPRITTPTPALVSPNPTTSKKRCNRRYY